MQIWRSGELRNSDLATGNTLSLELGEADIEALADPDRAYIMARFMQFKQTRLGWAPEDKAHVWLRSETPSRGTTLPATLFLDPGGDLYFEIWKANLGGVPSCRVFDDLTEFVTHDPSNRLQHLGIEIARIYGLSYLQRELEYGDVVDPMAAIRRVLDT